MLENLSSRHLLVAATALLAGLALAAPSRAHEAAGAEAPAQDQERIEVPVEDAATTTVVAEHKRVPLPTLASGTDHPFTIEVPLTWNARRDLPAPGVFLGPPGGDPNSHPEMVLVHVSDVALDAPEAILANLRTNAEGSEWSLREAEIRNFGEVRGLWIVREMPPTQLHGERVSYAVKLPLAEGSLDVIATLPREQDAALAPAVRHVLLSVRPAGADATAEPGF